MNRDKFSTFVEWFFANEEEYQALTVAQDGNLFPLAAFIESKGQLSTKEARAFVAAHLRGDKKNTGSKRTIAQQTKELMILDMIREIQTELNCGEHTARNTFLDRHADICDKDETLRTYIRRAKKTWKGIFGREPDAVVQKGRDFEPE